MTDEILHLLSPDHLPSLPGFLALFGSMMALYVAQLTSWSGLDDGDARIFQWLNRFAWLATSSVLFWLFVLTLTGDWGPYPPTVILLIAVDLQLLFRSLTLILAHHGKRKVGGNHVNISRRLEDEPFFAGMHRPGSRSRSTPHGWKHH